MNYNPLRSISDDLSTHSTKVDISNSDSNGIELSTTLSSSITDTSTITVKVNTSNVESALLNQATSMSTYINLTSTVVGSGILGLPFGYSKTGYILGTMILLTCGSLSYMGLYLLYLCASKTEMPSSFSAVAKLSSLSYISVLIDATVFLKCIGVATSYPIIIGDLMPQAMRQFYGASDAEFHHDMIYNRHFWVFIAFMICSPLCFFRSLDALKWTSLLSIFFIILLTCLMFSFAVRLFGMDPCDVSLHAAVCSYDQQPVIFDTNVLKSFPIFVYVFTCQHNTFAVMNELISPTPARVHRVFKGAILSTSIIYLIVSLSGYFTYGPNVASNVLLSYPDTIITSLARICVCFNAAFHYPIQCNPGRKSAMSIWKKLDNDIEPTPTIYTVRYLIITIFFVIFTFSIGFTVENLGAMFALIGATGSTSVTYIIPGLCYYYLHKNQGPVWLRYYAVLHLCIGLFIIPLALTFIFMGS